MGAPLAQIIEAEDARFSATIAAELAKIAAREISEGRMEAFEDTRARALRSLERAHAAMTAAGPRPDGKPALRLVQTPSLRIVPTPTEGASAS